MAEQMTAAQARARLDGSPAWHWVSRAGRQMWSAEDVRAALEAQGMAVSRDTITRWFAALPHTMRNRGPLGDWATLDDLLIFFAGRLPGAEEDAGAR